MVNPLHMKVLARPESAQEVRTVLRGWLGPRVAARDLDDAALIVTELVTNSVRHAGLAGHDVLRVRAAALDEVLLLEVEDDGQGRVPHRRRPDPIAGGIGLNLVSALSLDWGVRCNDGTTVWAELPCHQSG
jgi:serine/threonine-protein kinase RsbW